MGTVCILLPIHWDALKGGAEYQADLFSTYLANHTDYNVIYLAKYVSSEVNHHNYEIQKIPVFTESKRLGLFIDAVGLYKILKKINPNVIWQRGGCAYTGVAALYCKRNRKSLLWHIASDDDVKKKNTTPSLKKIPTIIDDMFLKYGMRNATKIIAQKKIQASMLYDNYQLSVADTISNFHPLDEKSKEKKWKVNGKLCIIWISNIKALKQPEIFLKLASDLKENKDIIFKIIGRRQKNQWCDDLIQTISESVNMEYVGELTIDEVNAELETSDLLVNTSLYEGFPNTFIQAWLREVPVASLNVDPDGVIENNGLGFHAKTYDALKEYILSINENIEELKMAGKWAKNFSTEKYSMKNARRLVDLIDTEM